MQLVALAKWIPATLVVLGAALVAPGVLVLAFFQRVRGHTLMETVSFFFSLSSLYLLLLITAAWMYIGDFYGVKTAIPWLVAGILPIGVPWFGALGAVTISLQGVFVYNERWDRRYSYWHVARPLVGAVVGTIAYFMYLLLIKATGATAPRTSTSVIDLVPFYVVAFVVGYREETFRSLIKAVTDLLLKPAGVSGETISLALEIDGVSVRGEYDFGTQPINSRVMKTVSVINIGSAKLAAVVGLIEPMGRPGPNGFLRSGGGLDGGDLETGASATVDVTFSPPSIGRFTATLRIMSAGQVVSTLQLRGQGA